MFKRFSNCCQSLRHRLLARRLTKKLQLNSEQQQRLQDIFTQLSKNQRALKDSHNSLRQQAIEMLKSGSLDKALASRLLQEKLDTTKERGNTLIDAMSAFFDELDQSQKKQLAEIINKQSCCTFRHRCCGAA